MTPLAVEQLTRIPLTKLKADPRNPREDVGDLEDLVASIKAQGIIEPLIVRPTDGVFLVVAGRRRWAAAKAAGLEDVPAIVRPYTDEAAAAASLIENLQRKDLDPLEEAQGYADWLKLTKRTQDDLAKAVGKARPTIANTIRLLGAPAPLKAALKEKRITAAHGRVLLQLVDESLFAKIKIGDVAKKTATVRDVQEQVDALNHDWQNSGAPAIEKAKKFLAEVKAAHPKNIITWEANRPGYRRESGIVDLVEALGKPPAAKAGDVTNARMHDKVCKCRAYEIDPVTRYSSAVEFDGEDRFILEGFGINRVCVDKDGWTAYVRESNKSARVGSSGGYTPKKKTKAEILAERQRQQRERRARIRQHIDGGGGYRHMTPGADLEKKLIAGGWAGEKAARLILLSYATEGVYTSADMPEIVRGILALKPAKVRELVLHRAAGFVHSNVTSRGADEPFDRRVAKHELLTAYGVKSTAPERKKRTAAKKRK